MDNTMKIGMVVLAALALIYMVSNYLKILTKIAQKKEMMRWLMKKANQMLLKKLTP